MESGWAVCKQAKILQSTSNWIWRNPEEDHVDYIVFVLPRSVLAASTG